MHPWCGFSVPFYWCAAISTRNKIIALSPAYSLYWTNKPQSEGILCDKVRLRPCLFGSSRCPELQDKHSSRSNVEIGVEPLHGDDPQQTSPCPRLRLMMSARRRGYPATRPIVKTRPLGQLGIAAEATAESSLQHTRVHWGLGGVEGVQKAGRCLGAEYAKRQVFEQPWRWYLIRATPCVHCFLFYIIILKPYCCFITQIASAEGGVIFFQLFITTFIFRPECLSFWKWNLRLIMSTGPLIQHLQACSSCH